MDIIEVAIKELGYTEQGENRTKYGVWYGMDGAPWCHMFVSWCAKQSGTNNVPKTASTSVGMQWYKDRGLFKLTGTYTPKRGDIVYFKTGNSHVGIVECVTGGDVHTIEGNSGDKVRRRHYPLNYKTITGYGVTSKGSGGNTPNIQSSQGKGTNVAGLELEYLNKILKSKTKPIEVKKTELVNTWINHSLSCTIILQSGKNKILLPVLDGMQLTYERTGMPGMLTFETIPKPYTINEGDRLLLSVNGKDLFAGFVFTKEKTKTDIMKITAYDQLRYLKNKDICIYTAKTASEIIKQIANKYKLTCGTIENTRYRMSKIECDITLFDIIQNALDETIMVKGETYVLYDVAGKLTLKNIQNMKVDSCVVDGDTAENYNYKSTIDSETYNQIKLVFEDEENGTFNSYIEKDSSNISKWGLLQYMEKINNEDVGKLKSQALLKYYNRKSRNISVDNCFGNTSVRAGSLIPVLLDLRDVKLQNYMLVEKVTHKFSSNIHKMDLILSGGDFVG